MSIALEDITLQFVIGIIKYKREKHSNDRGLNLTNKRCTQEVLLQTLILWIRVNGEDKFL